MSDLPIAGIHHVTLTVSDLDRSVAWYAEVLGCTEQMRLTSGGVDKALMRRGDLTISFVVHGEQAVPGRFDERRCGLDHLALAVADHDALVRWVEHLDALGVHHDGLVQAKLGELVAFRDPDHIALELYTLG